MKKRIIACALACAIICGCGVQTKNADPVSTKTAYAADTTPYAQTLVDMGILQGFEDGSLRLGDNLTRAQFSKLLFHACEKAGRKLTMYTGAPKFPDMPKEHWAYEYVMALTNSEVINGFEDGTFRPDDIVTYEQAAKLTSSILNIPTDGTYPTGYVSAAVDSGLTVGVNALLGGTLTRGDAAAFIANTIDYSKLSEYDEEERGYTSSSSLNALKGGIVTNGITAADSMTFAPMAQGAPMKQESVSIMAGAATGGGSGASVYRNPGYGFSTEGYTANDENVFKDALTSPLSTFSIDCDTASYSNMRRFILQGQKAPNGAIRTEELINYFDYDYPQPEGDVPFSLITEVSDCPWNDKNMLVLAAVQGKELVERAPSNLTFLIDVSGSMYSRNKLPLVKRSLDILLETLAPTDTVSIVTYASGVRTVLEGEPASNKDVIRNAFYSLRAGGGTAGAKGLETAYSVTEKFMKENNRIILCTDGDFNMGQSSDGELKEIVERERDKGIFISVLGFGMGNYKDSKLEIIADNGNGTYAYIDNIREAKKVLADEMTKTLFTIAKDVKIQAEFNPSAVKQYRLIGYENRVLANEDFANDKKDAGELGAGASVTALYEVVPADGTEKSELHFSSTTATGDSKDIMHIKLRYKQPNGTESMLVEKTLPNEKKEMSENMRFAAAVGELGMILNNSEYMGTSTLDSVTQLAQSALGEDKYGIRREFVQLVDLLRYVRSAPEPVPYEPVPYDPYDPIPVPRPIIQPVYPMNDASLKKIK